MAWKSKSKGKTDRRTSTPSSITKVNSRGYSTIEFENSDVGQVTAKDFTFGVGDEVTYTLETMEWSDGKGNDFTVVNVVDFKEEEEESGDAPQGKPINALKGISPKKLLYFDIECVRNQRTLDTKSEEFKSWEYKRRNYKEETTKKDLQESYKTDAGLYAEFSKVVCISIGRVDKDGVIVMNSYYGRDEADLLTKAAGVFEFFCNKGFTLAGLGIKGYDIPFLMRRMLIHRIPVPDCLDVAGAKPWEVTVIDIGELWKGTGFYSASLVNISTAMGLPSPKDGIDGSQVSDTFYKNKGGLEEIVVYCEKDVVTVINILMAMFGRDFIEEVVSKTFEDGAKSKSK